MFLFNRQTMETLLWTAGLLYLALWVDPFAGGHFNLCLVSLLGFEHCPGCGLGRSIAFLFRGELALSLTAHPLGFFAVAVLIGRIVSLMKMRWRLAVTPVTR